MSNNRINQGIDGEEAAAPGKALADALAVNTVMLKELDLSSNYLKAPFAEAFAKGSSPSANLTLSYSVEFKFSLRVAISAY